MLGKTNLVLGVENESGEVALIQENILTEYSCTFDLLKIANGKLFAINKKNKFIAYGEDINTLRQLAVEGNNILFVNGIYYVTNIQSSYPVKLMLYKSTDLIEFEEIDVNVMLEDNLEGYSLWYDSDKEKFVIFGWKNGYVKLYTSGNFSGGFEEKSNVNHYNQYTPYYFDDVIYANHRAICKLVTTSLIKQFMAFDLHGNMENVSQFPDCYGGGYYWISKDLVVYRSLNGVEYSKVYEHDANNQAKLVTVFEYNDNIAFVFSRKEDEEYSCSDYYIAIASNASVKAVEAAMQSKIAVTLEYGLQSVLCIDDTIYFGCEGGVIVKAHFDYAEEVKTPEVTLIKTLSAKQALEDAKTYTQQQFAILEARIADLENSQ